MTEQEIIETAIQGHASTRDAIRWAIKQALLGKQTCDMGELYLQCPDAQPSQEHFEPVGKFAKFSDGIWREVTDGSAGIPLYTKTQG